MTTAITVGKFDKAFLLVSLRLFGCLDGCAPTRNALPSELVSEAKILAIPNVRAFGGEHSPLFQANLMESIQQARQVNPRSVVDERGVVNILALSGGGADGAFGAGFLNGWSVEGTRPTFKLVTGTSAASPPVSRSPIRIHHGHSIGRLQRPSGGPFPRAFRSPRP